MFEAGQLLRGVKQQFDLRHAIDKMTMFPSMVLPVEEAGKFWLGVWDQTRMKNIAELIPMKTEKYNLRTLGMTGDILRPEGTMTAAEIVTEAQDNRVQLSAVEHRGGVLVKDADLEVMNITSAEGFLNAIMTMVKRKLANELERWAYQSESSTDMSSFGAKDIRSTIDGWRYQLDYSQSGEAYENSVTGSAVILDASNTVTAIAESFAVSSTDGPIERDGSAPYDADFKLEYFIRNMPTEYWELFDDFRFFMNPIIWNREISGERKLGTEASHMSLRADPRTGGLALFDGVPIVQCPLMSMQHAIYSSGQKEMLDTSTPGDLTDVILTPANNLVVGVVVDLMMEVARDEGSRGNIYWFTFRGDAKVRDVHAAVFGKRFKNAAV